MLDYCCYTMVNVKLAAASRASRALCSLAKQGAGFAARQGRATLSERFENITLTLVREAPAECEARLCRLSEAVSEARKAPSATPRCKLSAVLSSLNVS
jgi:hypothetical protein